MGVLANLPVGLAPGLGMNAYVSVILAPFGVGHSADKNLSIKISLPVRILRRWLPWKWRDHLSGSPGSRVPGGVSARPCLHVTNLTYLLAILSPHLLKVDFSYLVHSRP